MALTKPPVLPPWAEAGDKVQPTNAELQTGWPLSNTPPARQRWNWILNFLANGVRYLTRRGMPDYGADETYMIGDRVIGDDGKTYRSLQDNNTGNAPSASPLWWERWGYSAAELIDVINSKKATFVVRAASTVAINLAAPGANIDGVAMVAGDQFLEKDNGTGASRGIYVWNGAAVPATRAPEADAGTELKPGILIEVTEGATNADTLWTLSTDGAVTVGVTALTFSPMARIISTPPQFDNSTKLATTEFIKRAMGGLRGIVGKAAAGALGVADVGMLVEINAAVALTLPAANTVPAGEGFLLHSTIAGASAVRAGADVIYTGVGANSVSSLAINRGEHLWLLSNGANGWYIGGGSAALSFADCFGGSVASPGWQKLPSGLILQWGNNSFSTGGSAITFPIAFPNSLYGIMLGQGGNGGGYIFSQSQTLSGFSGYVSAGTTTTHWWLAVGR